jgi:octaprenyl-diphosphate synthase
MRAEISKYSAFLPNSCATRISPCFFLSTSPYVARCPYRRFTIQAGAANGVAAAFEVGSLRALEILSSAAAVIAEGEVMQLSAAKNTATTEDEYLAVIRAKTAELFAAACEVGPVIAGRPKAEQAACRSFGMNLGVAFQLVDDALDYGGKAARLGKNVGDDFREGKITLPVVLAFRRGSDGERAFWQRTLERGETAEDDLEQAIALMTKHRAIEDTVSRARHYGAIAKDALALFPAAPMKQALEDAVEFSIDRTH